MTNDSSVAIRSIIVLRIKGLVNPSDTNFPYFAGGVTVQYNYLQVALHLPPIHYCFPALLAGKWNSKMAVGGYYEDSRRIVRGQ